MLVSLHSGLSCESSSLHPCVLECSQPCRARTSTAAGPWSSRIWGSVAQGEELTLDYRAETESEKEPRHAICLCGARECRGSFLYHTNTASTPQQQACPFPTHEHASTVLVAACSRHGSAKRKGREGSLIRDFRYLSVQSNLVYEYSTREYFDKYSQTSIT